MANTSDGKTITGTSEFHRSSGTVEEIGRDNNGVETYRYITAYGPPGRTSMKTFLQGKPQAIETNEYDTQGRLVHEMRVEANGTVSFERTTVYQGEDFEQTMRTPQGTSRSVHKSTDTTEEWLQYDNTDTLVMRATFSNDQLTSWWMKPQANFGIGFGVGGPPGQSIAYSSTPEGGLERTVYIHPGRKGNGEPDEVLHYNADGILVEDARIRYELDAYGNWTTREITVIDADHGAVVVQRDEREITYW